jgi:hypothetical protein
MRSDPKEPTRDLMRSMVWDERGSLWSRGLADSLGGS